MTRLALLPPPVLWASGSDAFPADIAPVIAATSGSGRRLIERLCQVVGVHGRHVLLPALQCNVAIEPFVAAGAVVEFYEVDRCLQIDVDVLAARFRPDTALVMVVDYYGVSQTGLARLRELADRSGIVVLEDAVQSFPGKVEDGRWLGLGGHVGLVSLRKVLPVADGALLLADTPAWRERLGFAQPRNADGAVTKVLARALRARLRHALGFVRPGFPALPDPLAIEAEPYATPLSAGDISTATRRVLAATPLDRIAERRRRNWLAWQQGSAAWGLAPVTAALPPGAAPNAFAAWSEYGLEGLNRLRARGIQAAYWPSLPAHVRADVARYAATVRQVRGIVLLPCHQGIAVHHIARATATSLGQQTMVGDAH